MTLARTLATVVARHGADTVFGVPGGGPNLEVIGAVEAEGLRFVLAHGEGAAAIMASTYGWLTGRTAMAIATRGPGAASAVNGVAQATLDRFPLLMVTDCVPAADVERVAHQRIDQQQLMRAVTRASGRIGDDRAVESIVRSAIELTSGPPGGAVHLDFDPGASSQLHFTPTRTDDIGDIAHAQHLVAGATHPVVLVGLEALADTETLRPMIERLACPVLTTYQAAGFLPDGHRQLAGLFTSGAIERDVLSRADLVLAIGLDTVEPMPSPWAYAAPVVAVSAVPCASSFLPTTVQLQGSLPAIVAQLGPATSRWAQDAGRAAQQRMRAALDVRSPGGFGPIELVRELVNQVPSEAIATVDAGAHFLAVMPHWPAAGPKRLLISNGLATMGFSVPAAIAAALARPGTPVIAMVGDGGLGMTLAELETIARLDLPITVVVFNDAALSLIEIKQRAGQGGQAAVRYRTTDFAAVANAMGLRSAVVDSAEVLGRTLREGWSSPRLIDARIDPSPYGELIKATRG